MTSCSVRQPSPGLTKSELVKHRKRISAQRPSLPQQAGQALAKFESRVMVYLEALEALRRAPPTKRKRGTPPHLHFAVCRQASPDLSKVAIAMVRHFVAEERKRQEREARSDSDTDKAA